MSSFPRVPLAGLRAVVQSLREGRRVQAFPVSCAKKQAAARRGFPRVRMLPRSPAAATGTSLELAPARPLTQSARTGASCLVPMSAPLLGPFWATGTSLNPSFNFFLVLVRWIWDSVRAHSVRPRVCFSATAAACTGAAVSPDFCLS